jgi:hypothetical protein
VPSSPDRRRQIGDELLRRAQLAASRIDAGIALLDDPVVLDAFRIANAAMASAARRRLAQLLGQAPADVTAPAWRPFQLAFLLLSLPGIDDAGHDDRDVVDLLFFPTGGGKTEAYLGLAAFTLVLRRRRHPGLASSGVAVLMRYTLRLLTLDQLGRAAALMCALELARRRDAEKKLGEWPFEIGLWVGRAATPNRMGDKGDGDQRSAARRRSRSGTTRGRRRRSRSRSARGAARSSRRRRSVSCRTRTTRATCACAARTGGATSRASMRCRSWAWTSRSTGGCRAS